MVRGCEPGERGLEKSTCPLGRAFFQIVTDTIEGYNTGGLSYKYLDNGQSLMPAGKMQEGRI
jgi:hypothetical protein